VAPEHITIRRFDARTVPEEEIAALNAFNNVLVAERIPDNPPATFADALRECRAPTPGEERTIDLRGPCLGEAQAPSDDEPGMAIGALTRPDEL